MVNLEGKVAVITGAGSGIGRALALELAKKGCSLALTDIDGEGLAETARLVGGDVANCKTYEFDVSHRDAVEKFAADVMHEFGGTYLVINNAGVTLVDTVENMRYDDLNWLMDTNFWGVVYGTRAFLPHMLEAGEGHIVNISSLFGLMAMPLQAAYNASKFAVRGYTEALRIEMAGSPVNISCVHPGGVRTRIVENARFYEESVGISKEKMIARFAAQAKTSAAAAARTIIRGVEKNKKRILIGADASIADKIVRLFPGSYELRLGIAKKVRERALKRARERS